MAALNPTSLIQEESSYELCRFINRLWYHFCCFQNSNTSIFSSIQENIKEKNHSSCHLLSKEWERLRFHSEEHILCHNMEENCFPFHFPLCMYKGMYSIRWCFLTMHAIYFESKWPCSTRKHSMSLILIVNKVCVFVCAWEEVAETGVCKCEWGSWALKQYAQWVAKEIHK